MTDAGSSAAHRLRVGCLSEWDRRRPVRHIPERPTVSASVLQKLLERECRCAVCLDTVNSTTAVCACLHRFCRPCIEGSIRIAKPVCPTCKASVPSHRVLRDDARFQRIADYLTKIAEKHAKDSSENKSSDDSNHHTCFACSKEAAEALERQRKAAVDASATQKKEE